MNSSDFERFLAAIFEPTDIVEIRAIYTKKDVASDRKLTAVQTWHACSELPGAFESLQRHNEERCIYAGINPRTRMGGGASSDVALARCLFVDFDGGVTPEQATAKAHAAGLPSPTVVVSSGHGTHLYWRLEEPITDMAAFTNHQKALIQMLGTDGCIHDPPRIMRLPGFMNRKAEPVPCALIACEPDNRHAIAMLPTLSADTTGTARPAALDKTGGWKSRLSRKTMNLLLAGTTEPGRNSSIFAAACDMAGCGAPRGESESILLEAARRCQPPLADAEALLAIDSAYSKPRDPARPESGDQVGDGDTSESAETGLPQSERLVRLAQAKYNFGRTASDEPFAALKARPHIALLLKGERESLSASLVRDYRATFGRIPTANARVDAHMALCGETLDLPQTDLQLRVAIAGSTIELDLGRTDGKVVLINERGWNIADASTSVFRRTRLTSAMPLPERGGSLDELRRIINVTDRDWPLLVGWLVSCFIPNIPHAALMLGGEQGTGKSTAARFMVNLVDPSPAPLRTSPSNVRDWSVAACGSWVVVLDNVSTIADWLADAICRACTGDGLVDRALYTNQDVSVLCFRRIVAITSIDPGAIRGDFGDRLLLIDLERIDEDKRVDDAVLEQRYQEARPRILGALLDLLVEVMAKLNMPRPSRLPRMADFARVLYAMDSVLGTDSYEQFMDQRTRIAGAVVEAHVVAEKVRQFMQSHSVWEGTASELMEAIRPDAHTPDWPKSPSAFGGALRRLAPALRTTGVLVTAPKPTQKTRTFTLTRVEPERISSEIAAHAALPAQTVDEVDCQVTGMTAAEGGEGGTGGEVAAKSLRPCRTCGHKEWWQHVGDQHMLLTCGRCHPPSMPGEQVHWIAGEGGR